MIKTNRKHFITFIIIAILGIRFCLSGIHDIKFDITRNAYQKGLQNIENYTDNDGIIKNILVDADFYDSGSGDYYIKVDYANIKVTVSNDIENLSDYEKCSILHDYQIDIENLISSAKQESNYEDFIKKNASSDGYIKYKGKHVLIDNSAVHLSFLSDQYKYAFSSDYFSVIKNNFGGTINYKYTFANNKLKQFINIDAEQQRNAPELPYLGMREEYLRYTSLGKPDKVEECLDFDKLAPRARSKTYRWDKTASHGCYIITVSYRLHHSHNVDDYEDLPASDGYVSYMSYTDEHGNTHSEHYSVDKK